jgi:hypothetical protein
MLMRGPWRVELVARGTNQMSRGLELSAHSWPPGRRKGLRVQLLTNGQRFSHAYIRKFREFHVLGACHSHTAQGQRLLHSGHFWSLSHASFICLFICILYGFLYTKPVNMFLCVLWVIIENYCTWKRYGDNSRFTVKLDRSVGILWHPLFIIGIWSGDYLVGQSHLLVGSTLTPGS